MCLLNKLALAKERLQELNKQNAANPINLENVTDFAKH